MGNFKKRIGVFARLFVTLVISAPFSSWAETNPFFDPNAAKTVFSPSVEVTVGGKIPDSFKLGTAKNAAIVEASAKSNGEVTVVKSGPSDTRSRLIEKWGDPSKDIPVRTVDDAPTPFKAMMEALEAGDEELAQEFAAQFQRYTEKLERSNLTAANMLGDAAKQREQAAKAELEAIKQRLGRVTSAKDLEKLKQSGPNPGIEKVAGDVSDAQGKVQVFLFFSSSDTRSGAAAREVDELAQRVRGDSRVQIVGVAADMMGSQAALNFKDRYEISFPIIADTPLANSMGVKTLPSIAFVNPATQRIVLREGIVKAQDLKQVVVEMQRSSAS